MAIPKWYSIIILLIIEIVLKKKKNKKSVFQRKFGINVIITNVINK